MMNGVESLRRKFGSSAWWVEVSDAPSPASRRAYIERNCIAWLSNLGKPPIDAPSAEWLGSHSTQETIRQSGLRSMREMKGPFQIRRAGLVTVERIS